MDDKEEDQKQNQKKTDKNKSNNNKKTKEDAMKSDKEQEIKDNDKEMEESEDVGLIFEKESEPEESFTMWSVDKYLHWRYQNNNIILRYFIEWIIFGVLLVSEPVICLLLMGEEISWKKETSSLSMQLKWNLFVFSAYSIDLIFFLSMESFLKVAGAFLNMLCLYESAFCWEIIENIYARRIYFRTSMSCYFIFLTANMMYGEYEMPMMSLDDIENIVKTMMLWLAIYMGSIFLTKVIVRICTFQIRRSGYKKQIMEINRKSAIFKKMRIIADGNEDVIENFTVEYDNGMSLKYGDPMFKSVETAHVTANNIFALLKIKEISLKILKKYFPNDYKGVYKYLTGVDLEKDVNKTVKVEKFIKLSEELTKNRRDMNKTLRDQDYVFEKLDLIFCAIISYCALILLLYMLGANFKVFVTGVGTSVVTVSWIFADTIKMVFNCFVFLLVIRPYNCGDKVIVENNTYYVYKIDLLNTTFLTPFREIVYISNIKLFSIDIRNVARSPAQIETIEILLKDSAIYEKAVECADETKKLLENEIYFKDCRFRKIADDKIYFEIYHNTNFQNEEDMRIKRNLVIKSVKTALSKTGISHKESFVFSHSFV